jgi:glycosyltransferase involved in cell wall biosynthesis
MAEASGPCVSVIVTSYNQEQWLIQALDSVAAQTHRPLQLIVTDDGSSDSSVETIRSWLESSDLDRQLIASPRNMGLPAMLNQTIPHLAGEFVVVLNGDDWLDPDRIERQSAALQAADDRVGLVYCDMRVVDEAGTPTGDIYPPPEVQRVSGDALAAIIAGPLTGMPAVMFRRHLLDVIGPWDETLVADDFDFLLRAAASGHEFLHLPDALVNYRQSDNTLTKGRMNELAAGRFDALQRHLGATSGDIDDAIYTRLAGLACALHANGYDRRETNRRLRFVLRHAPSRRLVRAALEGHLGLRPRALARGRIR